MLAHCCVKLNYNLLAVVLKHGNCKRSTILIKYSISYSFHLATMLIENKLYLLQDQFNMSLLKAYTKM